MHADVSLPSYGEVEVSGYKDFFINYAIQNFDNYYFSKSVFDPNISDQLCHLRSLWLIDQYRDYSKIVSMHDDVLEVLGMGMILVKSIPYTINSFGMMDRWYDVKRTEFEELMGFEFTNTHKNKFVSYIKSYLSRKVKNYILNQYINKWSSPILADMQFQFSNKIHFSQKSVKIPFASFFISGLVFLEWIRTNMEKIVLRYRHFVIDNNEIYLNGFADLPIINNEININYPIHALNKNIIVIEAYSCHFLNEENKYGLSFHRNIKFDEVLRKLALEFDFHNFLAAAMSIHGSFHQPLNINVNDKQISYDNTYESEEYKQIIAKFQQKALVNGIGLKQWNPSKGHFLDESVPLNFFHIYPKHCQVLIQDFENNKQYLGKKYRLKRRSITFDYNEEAF
jgi:hypothetical protein